MQHVALFNIGLFSQLAIRELVKNRQITLCPVWTKTNEHCFNRASRNTNHEYSLDSDHKLHEKDLLAKQITD